jgi:hypothetical protein
MSDRLYLSFWDICLGNLPRGKFERVAITAADASALIRTARATKNLMCIAKDDLLAPYRQRERLRHEELCAVLRTQLDCPLHFGDFLASFGGKESVDQSVAPLELAELQPGERLLVVTCNYRLAENVERDMDPQLRFVVADDSVAFHLIAALHPSGSDDDVKQ